MDTILDKLLAFAVVTTLVLVGISFSGSGQHLPNPDCKSCMAWVDQQTVGLDPTIDGFKASLNQMVEQTQQDVQQMLGTAVQDQGGSDIEHLGQ